MHAFGESELLYYSYIIYNSLDINARLQWPQYRLDMYCTLSVNFIPTIASFTGYYIKINQVELVLDIYRLTPGRESDLGNSSTVLRGITFICPLK